MQLEEEASVKCGRSNANKDGKLYGTYISLYSKYFTAWAFSP